MDDDETSSQEQQIPKPSSDNGNARMRRSGISAAEEHTSKPNNTVRSRGNYWFVRTSVHVAICIIIIAGLVLLLLGESWLYVAVSLTLSGFLSLLVFVVV